MPKLKVEDINVEVFNTDTKETTKYSGQTRHVDSPFALVTVDDRIQLVHRSSRKYVCGWSNGINYLSSGLYLIDVLEGLNVDWTFKDAKIFDKRTDYEDLSEAFTTFFETEKESKSAKETKANIDAAFSRLNRTP